MNRTVPTARLRLLETTDLHMQILAYDYFSDRDDDNVGLIRLGGRIETLRGEDGVTCLLFDNGDFLQGNPLADYMASAATDRQVHPMVAAFNLLEYDAVTLGNHEFNYGLPFLQQVLADAQFPITCANVRGADGAPLVPPFVIISRDMACSDGIVRPLRIGVTGFVTPQITDWDEAALAKSIETDDIVHAARKVVPQMRAAGADVIVALCHSGIGATHHSYKMENAAVPLAALDGIDVILTGHTHKQFPGAEHCASEDVDPASGTLHGKPTVMAGYFGNCLGVVDLTLGWCGNGWQILQHASRLQDRDRPDRPQSALQNRLTDQMQLPHKATLTHIRRPIAWTDQPINNYFASIKPDLCQQLLAEAQRAHVAGVLADSDLHHLPVLSATAPFRAGGRGGPGHFVEIAPGPVTLRHAAAIYPFANTIGASLRSGAEIAAWLERSATYFLQITPGLADQDLINPESPSYHCDKIFGLTYTVDLSQPPRYDPEGGLLNPDARRIGNMRYRGKPVAPDDWFVVASNSYRMGGGGSFPGMPDPTPVYRVKLPIRDLLISFLRDTGRVTGSAQPSFDFAPLPDTSATFLSSPAARDHLQPGITHVGPASDGFDRYRLTF